MEKRNTICLAVDGREQWTEILDRLYEAGATGIALPEYRSSYPEGGGLLYLPAENVISWDRAGSGRHRGANESDIRPASWLTDKRIAELLPPPKPEDPFKTWAAPGKFVRRKDTGEIDRVAGRCAVCEDNEVHLNLGWNDEIPKQPLVYWGKFGTAAKLAALEPWTPKDGEVVEPTGTDAFGLSTPKGSLLRMDPDEGLSLAYPDGRTESGYGATEYARKELAACGKIRPTKREWPAKKPAKISLAWLRSRSACPSGLEWFETTFGKEAEVSAQAVFAALEAESDPATESYAAWLRLKLAE